MFKIFKGSCLIIIISVLLSACASNTSGYNAFYNSQIMEKSDCNIGLSMDYSEKPSAKIFRNMDISVRKVKMLDDNTVEHHLFITLYDAATSYDRGSIGIHDGESLIVKCDNQRVILKAKNAGINKRLVPGLINCWNTESACYLITPEEITTLANANKIIFMLQTDKGEFYGVMTPNAHKSLKAFAQKNT